jgi:hypothetical protein
MSHCSCSSVRRSNLYELDTISIEFISRGVQGCAGPTHIVSLLVVDYPNSLHGMARTRVCDLLYQTTTSVSKIPLTAIRDAGQAKEGECNHIQSISTRYIGIYHPTMENNTRGYRAICRHRQFLGHKTDNVDTSKEGSR